MKIKSGFVMNKVGNQYVVVPVGQMSVERHCMVRLNGSGAFLWERLQSEATQEQLVEALLEEFEVTADVAAKDVAAFLQILQAEDLLEA